MQLLYCYILFKKLTKNDHFTYHKENLDAHSPKLEDIIQFYLDHKGKLTMTDTAPDLSQQSMIAFRSDESSLIDSSTQDSIHLSESMTESDDSPVGPKRKRKDSRSDVASLPSTKRLK